MIQGQTLEFGFLGPTWDRGRKQELQSSILMGEGDGRQRWESWKNLPSTLPHSAATRCSQQRAADPAKNKVEGRDRYWVPEIVLWLHTFTWCWDSRSMTPRLVFAVLEAKPGVQVVPASTLHQLWFYPTGQYFTTPRILKESISWMAHSWWPGTWGDLLFRAMTHWNSLHYLEVFCSHHPHS